MSMALIAGGVTVAAAGYKVYDTAHKNSQAKKLAASNKRPVYNADGTIREVYDIAAANLDNTSLLDYGTNQLEQGQFAGIDAILKSGGRADFGTINNAYGSNLKALIAQMDAKRDQRVATYNNAAYNLSQSRDAEFQYNQDAPFKDKKQQEAMLRQQAEQSKNEAISLAGSAVANYGIATTKPGQYGTTGNIAGNTANTGARVGQQVQPPQVTFAARGNTLDASTNMPVQQPNVIPGAVNNTSNYANVDYTRPGYFDGTTGQFVYTDGF